MSEERPTYWQIVLAYLEEGYRAWRARDAASAVKVETELGLSITEAWDFRRDLRRLGLIALAETHDDPGDYRLLPPGIAFMDGFPAIDELLEGQLRRIERAEGFSPMQKAVAKRRWRDVIIEKGIGKGVDYVWENRHSLWRMVQSQVPGLPDLPA